MEMITLVTLHLMSILSFIFTSINIKQVNWNLLGVFLPA